MTRLLEEAKQKQKEADVAWNKVRTRNTRIAKYWHDRFVITHREGVSISHDLTDEGKRELKKHKLYYDPDQKLEFFNKNGVAYGKKYVCGICGDKAWKHIEYGGWLGPRYAVCPKHNKFLFMEANIFKGTR